MSLAIPPEVSDILLDDGSHHDALGVPVWIETIDVGMSEFIYTATVIQSVVRFES